METPYHPDHQLNPGPIRSYQPTSRHIKLLNEGKLNQLSKENSRAITNLHIGDFLTPSTFFRNPKDLQNLRKTANILHQQKLISSLSYIIRPPTAFGVKFAISKIRTHSHYVTSLSLEFPSLHLSTLHNLQTLFKTLIPFKNLTSLTITFPVQLIMTPELFFSLFSALSRLPFLQNLTLNFAAFKSSLDHYVLSKCLQKLPKLKFLSLNFEHCFEIHNSVLISLASAFQRLTLLNTLRLNLFGAKNLQASLLQSLFTNLTALKSLKYFYLNLGYCELDDLSTDPLSQGLQLLQSAPLESLSLLYYSGSQDNASEGLAKALQNFPSLQHLHLDLSLNSQISNDAISKLAWTIQQLKSLSFLHLNLPSGINMTIPAQIPAIAVKPLLNLTSLNLTFAIRPQTENEKFILFSESLAGLTRLTQLSLALSGLWGPSDQPVLSENKVDEHLIALGNSLKNLTNLTSLKFEFSDMRTLTDKGMIGFCAGLARLKKLTCLYLDFHGSPELNKDGMIILGAALKRITLLKSLNLNLLGCVGTANNVGLLYKDLGQLKLIENLKVKAPFSNADLAASFQNLNHIPQREILWG